MSVSRVSRKRKLGPRRRYKPRARVVRRKGRVMGRIMRPITPFPSTKIVRHRYVETVTLPTATAGLPTAYNVMCNSIYDPNNSGVGHQPLYHDEMAAQYSFYTVIAAYIRITINPTNTAWGTLGVKLTTDGTLPSNADTLLEQEGYKVPFVPSNLTVPVTRRASFDAKKEFKTTFAGLMGDPDHKSVTGANPASAVSRYFTIFRTPGNTSATVGNVDVQMELIQICAWREPKNATGS